MLPVWVQAILTVLYLNQAVSHELCQGHSCGHIVVTVDSVQFGVLLVLQDGRWQAVVGAEVCDFALRVFHNVRVDDTLTRQKPMGKLAASEVYIPSNTSTQIVSTPGCTVSDS